MPKHNNSVDERRGEVIEPGLRMPHDNEVIGVVTKLAGATRFVVKCSDDKERLCNIPGKLKRSFWIKEKDVVLVKPWIVQSDERGDIIWRYSQLDINKLKSKGLLNFDY
ncbi:MAG: translation initiation factor eIF-1A [Candidatus Micrarchaeia archaeon]